MHAGIPSFMMESREAQEKGNNFCFQRLFDRFLTTAGGEAILARR